MRSVIAAGLVVVAAMVVGTAMGYSRSCVLGDVDFNFLARCVAWCVVLCCAVIRNPARM